MDSTIHMCTTVLELPPQDKYTVLYISHEPFIN